MAKRIDLLEGPIFPALAKLSLPIMATSFIQMAYNMTDMIWIGRIGSDAVAAVGAAGMFLWLSQGLAALPRMGGQVRMGQALGRKDTEEAAGYAQNALQLGLLFGILYGLVSIFFSGPLIGFFKLNSPEVIYEAGLYLKVTCGGVIFSFINIIFSGIFTAMGSSHITLVSTIVGLGINLVLDPLLIFGIGPFPEMGVLGAAAATVFAQAIVTCVYVRAAGKDGLLRQIRIFGRPQWDKLRDIAKIGIPSSLQNMAFTCINMVVARFIAGWGDGAIAVQKVGSQIEAISWMTADGFAVAVNSIMAQNYGAGNLPRVIKSYRTAIKIMGIWGTFCSLVLIFLPGPIFQIFIPGDGLLNAGIGYLQILGVSQLFMCLEITTEGAFAGLGKTVPPSVVGITLTAARIPMAMILSATALGLNGIWWSISISGILKGVVLVAWFVVFWKRVKKRSGYSPYS